MGHCACQCPREGPSFQNAYRLDHRLVRCRYRTVSVYRLCIPADPVNDIHSIGDITESRILAIQIEAVRLNDKKLRACTVRIRHISDRKTAEIEMSVSIPQARVKPVRCLAYAVSRDACP